MVFLTAKFRTRPGKTVFGSALCLFILNGCGEFNRPVVPLVSFDREVIDERAGVRASFGSAAPVLTLSIDRNGGPLLFSSATLFVKLRCGGEFLTRDLSGIPFDFRVEIEIDTVLFPFPPGGVTYVVVDGEGDTLRRGLNSFNNEGSVSLYLFSRDELPRIIVPFFWQLEIHGRHETLKLPNTPGLWYSGVS